MKIYDCFSFLDENLMLDLRLNILNKFVDKFVVVENIYMQSGVKKKPVFDISNFPKFKDKIIYILVEKLPKNYHDVNAIKNPVEKNNKAIDNGMMIDHDQRNNIEKGLKDSDDNDLIIIGDVDEVPNLELFNINNINKKLIYFKQKMFCYKFNLLLDSKIWHGSKACLKKNLISPQWIRDTKERKYPLWRLDIMFSKTKYNSIHYVQNGGWHFTHLKSPEDLYKKMKNWAHYPEFNQSGLNLNDIKNMIINKMPIYDYNADMKTSKFSGKGKLIKCDVKILPKYLIENKKLYFEWLD